MLLVCGFLGCLGQAFKRSPSTTSSGVGEQPSNTHHNYGDRHQHGDRYHGRGSPAAGHGRLSPSGPHAGASSTSSGLPSEQEQRAATGANYATPPAGSQPVQYDGDVQAGAAVAAAAVAAATQPAMLVKLDRGGASRRTPLHVAAERGQLHVLSAIIESLCCSATAGLLGDDDGGGGGTGVSNSDEGVQNAGRSYPPGGEWGEAAQEQQADGEAAGRARQQQRGSSGAPEEFPVARPGAAGVPLAPDQYIQFHLNMQDADGTTALSLACRFGHVDCCRLLLANGSARILPDARGNTPLHYAALRGHLGVVFMLLDEFVEPGQEDELVGYVDARNHAGCTPLHYSVWGRQSGSVQVLLQHGADVLPRNSRPAQELTPPVMVVGSTPLHLAAARGHVEICRIILKTFAERVLEPLQLTEDDPQPPTLAALDPRVQVNANGHMPYQVAQRLGFYPLAMLLRPSIPILRLFSDEERAVRFYGPAPLRAIAAEALNKKLLAELDALAALSAAAPTQPAAAATGAPAAAGGQNQQGRQRTPQPGQSAASEADAAGGGGGESPRRPVSAPATWEQLAAAAMDEAEDRGAAGQQGWVAAPQDDEGLSVVQLGGPQTATSGPSAPEPYGAGSQRRPAPRYLHLEVSTDGGGSDSDGRAGPSPPRPVPHPTAGPGPSPFPSQPRTPPSAGLSGGSLISPSGVSPRILSPPRSLSPPGSLVPASPSAGLLSPAGSPYQQQPSRGSSSHRSTPPLSSQRSNNSMMPAAPMVASLSRPPSAPWSNGNTPGAPRGQVLLSLPGQPDVMELQAAVRSVRPEQAAGEQAAQGDAGAALGAGSGGGGGGDAADGVTGGSADGGAGPTAMYGPRTPVRQPSSGTLHVRRTPPSPPGTAATSAAISVAGDGGGRGVVSPFAVGNDGPAAGLLHSVDTSRPAGLVRLRSNPLFEDTLDSAGAARQSAATGSGSPGATTNFSMPSLAEDAAEGEDVAGPASSCVVVMPFEQRPPVTDGAAGAAAGAGGGALAVVMSYSDDEDLECGVCMEPLPMVAVAPCRHQICGPCARRICCLNIQKPSHCPFCRATIAAFVAPAPLDPHRM